MKTEELLYYKELLRVLKHILNGQPIDKSYGICHQIMDLVSAVYSYKTYGIYISRVIIILNYFRPLCKEWPLYSGDTIYPIPGGEERYDDQSIDKWSGQDLEYRRDLIKFLINKIENKLPMETVSTEKWTKPDHFNDDWFDAFQTEYWMLEDHNISSYSVITWADIVREYSQKDDEYYGLVESSISDFEDESYVGMP